MREANFFGIGDDKRWSLYLPGQEANHGFKRIY